MATLVPALGDFHAVPDARNADRYAALDQVIADIQRLSRVGAIVWPGDLNHRESVVSDRNAIDDRCVYLASIAPLLICRGNHDPKGELLRLGRLKTAHPIYVFEEPGTFRFKMATGEWATVFVLPYPEKGGLVGAGVAPGAIVSTAADVLEPIFMKAADELLAARCKGDITFMIGHVNVAGAVSSTGQPQIGHEIELNPRHLDRLGDIPKLLAHIHKPQEIAGAYYIGSIARQNYGETEEKRFLVVTFSDDEADGQWRDEIDSVAIDTPAMFHVDGVLTRSGFSVDSFDESLDEEIHRRLAACDWARCDVRVRVRYQASERAALDFESVRPLFAGAYRLKIETVAVADRDLRAPEVAQAKTLEQKLAAFRKEPTLAPSIVQKLALLQQPDAAALIAADVQARLAAIAGIRTVERAA